MFWKTFSCLSDYGFEELLYNLAMRFFTNEQIDKIRKGYFSAVYFNRTKQILLNEKNPVSVTMQIFQKQSNIILAGVEPVKELLNLASGYFDNNTWIDKSHDLKIESLNEGSTTNSRETVAHISGPYAYFAHLESLYLGIFARCSKVASNTKKIVTAAGKKSVLFFADRFDFFANQEQDGYSAKIGGATGVATEAQAHLIGQTAMGTIPHALIAVHNGSTLDAAQKFAENFPDVPLIVLADFDNDCVGTSVALARKFGKKLFGVRIDTSESLIDKSLDGNRPENYGVNPQLVRNVREALDKEGFNFVKIVVSGGFNEKKIKSFEEEKVPVDIYGVGSSLLQGNIDFTADIVKVEDKEVSKTGRKFTPIKI